MQGAGGCECGYGCLDGGQMSKRVWVWGSECDCERTYFAGQDDRVWLGMGVGWGSCGVGVSTIVRVCVYDWQCMHVSMGANFGYGHECACN